MTQFLAKWSSFNIMSDLAVVANLAIVTDFSFRPVVRLDWNNSLPMKDHADKPNDPILFSKDVCTIRRLDKQFIGCQEIKEPARGSNDTYPDKVLRPLGSAIFVQPT